MKKNLRIVSVAAALLAVAPVAATAMPVNAATTVNINGNTSTPVAQNADVKLATNFTAIAYVAGQNSAQGTNGVVSGISVEYIGRGISDRIWML